VNDQQGRLLRPIIAALCAGALLCCAAGTAAEPIPSVTAGELPRLLDQFGQPVSATAHAGEHFVLIAVSARRLRRIKPWEKALREAFPDLPILRVADLPADSKADYERVAEKLRKRLPEDVRVGIDIGGIWAARLAVDTRSPNLLLFDPDGRLLSQWQGNYRKKRFPAVRDAITALLGDPATPAGAD